MYLRGLALTGGDWWMGSQVWMGMKLGVCSMELGWKDGQSDRSGRCAAWQVPMLRLSVSRVPDGCPDTRSVGGRFATRYLHSVLLHPLFLSPQTFTRRLYNTAWSHITYHLHGRP
jgi:hypothetical protein